MRRHRSRRRPERCAGDRALLGAQRPRGHDDPQQEDRRHDVAEGVAHRRVGHGGCREVEDHAGVSPFLEPGEARRQHGQGAEELPDAEEDDEVGGIAEVADPRHRPGLPQELEDPSRAEDEGREARCRPVTDRASIHGRNLLI